MARKLNSIQEIKDFVIKVIVQANHHSPEVEKIIPILESEVLKRLDLNTDEFSVYERKGNMARTCWVVLGGHRYVFTYNYNGKHIKLLKKSLRGTVIHRFDNSTPIAVVQSVIAGL